MIKISQLVKEIYADVEEIKRGMKVKIKRAFAKTIQAMDEWKSKYFPKEYGSLRQASKAVPHIQKEPFYLKLTSGDSIVDYAIYVEAMGAGTKWTNPNTETHYFKKWGEYGLMMLIKFLREELGSIFVSKNVKVRLE